MSQVLSVPSTWLDKILLPSLLNAALDTGTPSYPIVISPLVDSYFPLVLKFRTSFKVCASHSLNSTLSLVVRKYFPSGLNATFLTPKISSSDLMSCRNLPSCQFHTFINSYSELESKVF